MQQDDSLTTSKDDPARSEAAAEVPHRKVVRGVLAWDPWLRELFEMRCRAKKVIDANPDLYPDNGLSPRLRHTSRKLNMTPSERKQLADGVRAARRRIRALQSPNVRL
jgi:hypothetical protein